MFKGIATAAFGFGVIMSVAVMVSQPASTASVVSPNTTVIEKNMLFPLKANMTVDPCAVAYCADV
ncbi:MAG TPA: hypothetical protein VIB38_06220 [Aestuariivirgaceae bacterium]